MPSPNRFSTIEEVREVVTSVHLINCPSLIGAPCLGCFFSFFACTLFCTGSVTESCLFCTCELKESSSFVESSSFSFFFCASCNCFCICFAFKALSFFCLSAFRCISTGHTIALYSHLLTPHITADGKIIAKRR